MEKEIQKPHLGMSQQQARTSIFNQSPAERQAYLAEMEQRLASEPRVSEKELAQLFRLLAI